MNRALDESSFMFNDEMYDVGDEIIVLDAKKEWAIGKSGKIVSLHKYRKNIFDYVDRITILIFEGNSQTTTYTIELTNENFKMELANPMEVELI